MATDDVKNKKIVKGVMAVFLLFGAALLIFGVSFVQQARLAVDWPSVEGRITSTEIRSSSDRNSARRFYALVEYGYKVDGQSYSSSRYRLGDGPNTGNHVNAEDAKEAAKKWPAGSTIPVYYDPEDPQSAVLEPQASWGVYVPGIMGSFFFGLGLLPVLAMRRQGKSA